MPARPLSLDAAARTLRAGGVIAYPTEAVWGLGCDPFNEPALARLLAIKQRPVAKGMIVIAARPAQVERYLRWNALAPERREQVLASWPGPNTWLIPCTDAVPPGLRGEHDTLAVRVTAHPVATALCEAFGGPIVSTSANRAGEPPARRIEDINHDVRDALDGWVGGETGDRALPSTIRDARDGRVVRPG
jgi:L-threonylcarbamoyladenylate synthase